MRYMVNAGFWVLVFATTFWGCSKKAESNIETSPVSGKPLTSVETKIVRESTFLDSIDIIGTLEPKQQADLKFEYPGVIAEVYVDEWIAVQKGQPLARLDTRETEVMLLKAQAARETAKANLLQVKAQEIKAAREYERASGLMESGLITQQMFQDAETSSHAAQAALSAAEAQVRLAENEVRQAETLLSKSVLRAPIDGIISLSRNHVGDAVVGLGAQDPDFRIVDSSILKLLISVSSSQINKVALNQRVLFKPDESSTGEFEGAIKFINPMVDETSRSVKLTVEIDNTDGKLRGGMFVKGRIITGQRDGIIRIPKSSLLEWNVAAQTAQVFIADNDIASLREVRTGEMTGGDVEIREGLNPGEQLIVRGGFNLQDGETVKIVQGNGD